MTQPVGEAGDETASGRMNQSRIASAGSVMPAPGI